jgi:hypothetical protein
MKLNLRRIPLGLVGLTSALLMACQGSDLAPQTPVADDSDAVNEDDSQATSGAGKSEDAGKDKTPSSPAAHDGGADAGEKSGAQPVDENGCPTFEGSFEAIQKIIFERHGCTASACHGEAKVGGLDLRAEVAYENLVDATSANSRYARVQPGTATDSFLYQKLRAATEPGSLTIAGSPMPVGTAPLSANELEAIQLWIKKGAPKTGNVADQTKNIDVGSLLDACLPPATPVKAKPLEPPAPDEGVQIVLPSYLLAGGIELEQCTPFAYDVSAQVPDEYKDTTRNVMFVNGSRVRQDPQSHHLVLMNPTQALTSVSPTDPEWKCHGGDRDGEQCNAQLAGSDCSGGGVCAGKSTPGTLCGIDTTKVVDEGLTLETIASAIGVLASGNIPVQIANTQSPQQYTPPFDGVFQEIPLRGILQFNSHAFNLTEQDTVLAARVNYYYAKDRGRELRPVNVASDVFIADGQAPFTRKTYCSKSVVPQNDSLAMMTGHTHRRGEHFWVTDAMGTKIYENFDYNDPEYRRYEPWLEFKAADEASRTLEYCATYNNGLTKDDQPDLELVTRASRMPEHTKCTPVACVAGKVKAACTTDRDCDSASGANDGDCDACPITAGQTTENEMFVMMPWYVLPPK